MSKQFVTMKKTALFFVTCIACNLSQSVWGQTKEQNISVTVQNDWIQEKKNEPIVIKLNQIHADFTIHSATVWDGTKEIPSQTDDLNRDGEADELAFVIDLPAQSSKTLQVRFSSASAPTTYPAQVYAQMKLNDKGQKHPPIQYLSVPGTTPPKQIYSALAHHGPAFESDLVAYRIYFDNRQSIDIYGKKLRQLELETGNYYSSQALRKEKGYGNDVLWAGKTVSAGSFRGWENNEPQYIDKVSLRSEGILAYGPIRTVVEVDDRNWEYQGKKLNMTQHYILYAGHRDLQVNVSFKEPSVKENTFCTGVMKVEENNIGFLQPDGLAGSWGTNLPEKTDTINNPRETVGLGVCVPKRYVSKTVEDDANYLVVVNTDGDRSLSYHLTFCAAKEENGFKGPNAWFAYLRQWQQALQHPCQITIK